MRPTDFSAVLRRTGDEAKSPALQGVAANDARACWREALRSVRSETERRAAVLSAEDQTVQSMPDASPTKWHRAHVTWFFEQFLLLPHLPDYRAFDQRFAFLFNSYYVAAVRVTHGRGAALSRGLPAVTLPPSAHTSTPLPVGQTGARYLDRRWNSHHDCLGRAHALRWPAVVRVPGLRSALPARVLAERDRL